LSYARLFICEVQ